MRPQEPVDKVEGMSLVHGRKLPVVRAQRAGVVGELEDFDRHFERQRTKRSGPVRPEPKMEEIQNLSMSERMAQIGIQEEQ